MSGPGLCPSAPHRAILGLVGTALGHDPDPALARDLAASDPDALVRIAFDAYVHVVVSTGFDRAPELATGVPADLVVFFREMQAANLRRNDAIRAQLAEIGAAFSAAGLGGIALKGSAELLSPVFPDPGFRFLSDIDILLPADKVAPARDCLVGIGAVAATDEETAYAGHHHTAPLGRPDWPVPVELHRAIGQDAADLRVLPAATVLAGARASGLAGLAVPAPAHRLAHAVLHAQVHSQRLVTGVLSVRDALEFEIFARHLSPADLAAAEALFGDPRDHAAWQALDAARRLIFADGTDHAPLPAEATAWARKALTLYGQPRRQRLRTAAWTARRFLSELLFDPVLRRHHLRLLARPVRLRRTFAHHRDTHRRIR